MKPTRIYSLRTKVDKARIVVTALHYQGTTSPFEGWVSADRKDVRRKARLPMDVLEYQYDAACKALQSRGVIVPAGLPQG